MHRWSKVPWNGCCLTVSPRRQSDMPGDFYLTSVFHLTLDLPSELNDQNISRLQFKYGFMSYGFMWLFWRSVHIYYSKCFLNSLKRRYISGQFDWLIDWILFNICVLSHCSLPKSTLLHHLYIKVRSGDFWPARDWLLSTCRDNERAGLQNDDVELRRLFTLHYCTIVTVSATDERSNDTLAIYHTN